MSAAGHQVLSFVTSSEMTITKGRIARFNPALGEITEVKDVGCVAEFVMPVYLQSAYGRDRPDG